MFGVKVGPAVSGSLAAAVALLLAAVGMQVIVGTGEAVASPAAPTSVLSPLHVDGGRFVDGDGRVVLLHGVNNVDKEPPYIDPSDGDTVTAQDAERLAQRGLNLVRLGVEFDGLMPQEGVIDHQYIARLVDLVDMLAGHGIYTLLDNHQDSLSPAWGGNGFPEWAVHARPAAGEGNPGFPLNYLMPSMNAGWDEVWDNTYGVQDHLADALGALAGAVRGHPGVAGIELLNEPWPGNAYLSCFPDGCPGFDAKYQAALEKWTDAVRARNPDVPVFWEPNVTWNETMPSHLDMGARPGLVFSAHDYCVFSQAGIYLGSGDAARSLCPVQYDKSWANVDAVTGRYDVPAVITEFGDVDSSVLGETLRRADERFLGWAYWHYPTWSEDGERVDPLATPAGDALIRTYPQATAGTPGRMRFDPATGDFVYRYTPAGAGGETDVYVSSRHYPDGYEVEVDGGAATSAAGARVVTIAADGPGDVTVRIHRPGRAPLAVPTAPPGTGSWQGSANGSLSPLGSLTPALGPAMGSAAQSLTGGS